MCQSRITEILDFDHWGEAQFGPLQTLCVGRCLNSVSSLSRLFRMKTGPLLTGKIGWISNTPLLLFWRHPLRVCGFPFFSTEMVLSELRKLVLVEIVNSGTIP